MIASVKEQLTRAAKDEHVKAIVLRINRPGGTVTASDIIYHELKTFKARQNVPVVASIMDLGTRGATTSPRRRTGIGASLVGDRQYRRDYADDQCARAVGKVGVEATAVTSGPRKDMGSPFGP